MQVIQKNDQITSDGFQNDTKTTRIKHCYLSPTLKKYGSVAMFTKGQASVGTDVDGTKNSRNTSSDRRLKENVVLIGEHPLGIGIYLFDYKPAYRDAWGHGRQFGVMADEVERVMPEAVSVHSNGYKMVNYAMLGINAV